jgi:hypothetical protein
LGGVSVGEFEEEGMDDGANDHDGFAGRGQLDLVLPAIEEKAGADQGWLAVGDMGINNDVNAAEPEVREVQGAEEGAFNVFAGDDEDVRGEFDEVGRLIGEAAGGWSGDDVSGSGDQELA